MRHKFIAIYEKNTRFFRYVIAGGLAALVDFGFFISSYYGLPLIAQAFSLKGFSTVLIANAVGTAFGFLTGFYLQRAWAFKSTGELGYQFVFVLALLIFNVITGAFLIESLSAVGVLPAVSKIILQGMVVGWNYLIFSRYIFKV